MNRIILFAATLAYALTASFAARAENALVATCTGEGADFLLSSVSQDDAALIYGIDTAPSSDATLVVDADGENPRWSEATRAVIDQECGGDGNAEIALFPPVTARSGTWLITLRDQHSSGCSAAIKKQAMAATKKFASNGTTNNMQFETPFHPRPLMQNSPKPLQWVQRGATSWRTLMYEGGDAGSMRVTVTLDAEVRSPTHIVETQRQRYQLPGMLARVMGSSTDCRFTVVADLHWQE